MPQYKGRRIVRVNQFEVVRKQKRGNDLTEDFNLLFRVLLFAGLAFPPLNARKHQKPKRCERLFEAAVHSAAVLIILVNIFFWQRRYSSVTLHFSTTLTIFLAIAVRFALAYCRKKVPGMVRNLIALHDDVKPGRPPLKRSIVLACCMPVLLTTVASVIDVYNLLSERTEHSVQFVVRLNGAQPETWMYYMFLALVPVKMYFAYGVSVVIFIFVCVVYTVAKRTVLALDEQVSERARVGVYLNFYNRLGKAVAEIDDVLSPSVLLLYGLMVSGQLYTLTVLISRNAAERPNLTIGVQNVIVFLLTTVAFLVVTLTATKMTEFSENVKRSVHKMADRMVARSGESEERGITNTYMILITILNGSHLSFTGWGMFNINKSFILTTMGVMISYGFIIVQIGHKNGKIETF